MNTVMVSMDSESAIVATSAALNDTMSRFDRWVSQNPDKLVPTNDEFRTFRQTVKVLRLRLKELEEIQRTYTSTVSAVLKSNQSAEPPSLLFCKSRNRGELQERQTMKLGTRPAIKVSRG